MIRARAIACALWFGLLPWRFYEDECHYAPMGYLGHLWLNLTYAACWLTRRETAADHAFELEVNGPIERNP
jgi:hypothetical protein